MRLYALVIIDNASYEPTTTVELVTTSSDRVLGLARTLANRAKKAAKGRKSEYLIKGDVADYKVLTAAGALLFNFRVTVVSRLEIDLDGSGYIG